jgi:hypothetical protein
MQKDVYYDMQANAPDPRNGGSTKSWWFFYKWRAGLTWVPAKEGCERAEVGDTVWFTMDGMLLARSVISHTCYNLQGEKELHFDSDHLSIPTTCFTSDVAYVGRPKHELVFQDLATIPEGAEPQWLQSWLIKEHP